MKPVLSLLILLSFILCNQSKAQDSTLFSRGEIGANKEDYTGTIWLNELIRPDSNFTFGAAQADENE